MKKLISPISLSWLILFIGNVNILLSNPIISNVTVSPSINVEMYDRLQITFDMNNYPNPYDTETINVYSEFWSPSGKYFKVFGFYYSDFSKSNQNCAPCPGCASYPCEILTPTGKNNWRIRFTPNEPGIWTYQITAIDNDGKTAYPASGKSKFICERSSNKGFIVKTNDKFLKRSTGEFYFPVGENLPWYNSTGYRGKETYGTNEYKYYIDKHSENQGNFLRVWLDFYEGIALIGWDFTEEHMYIDLYNQKDAWQLDWILEYARSKDVGIMLCLFSHASWGDSDYTNCNWTDSNPFNKKNGGPIGTPYEFFSNELAIKKTKKLLRYIVARYGYATNLVAWELWNEVSQIPKFNIGKDSCDGTPISKIIPPSNYRSSVQDWHNKMYEYIRQIDPYNHLVTTSNAGSYNDEDHVFNIEVFSEADFSQSHRYLNEKGDFQKYFYDISQEENIINPHLVGEWGVDPPNGFDHWINHDPYGFELHNTLWSTSFSTSLGAAVVWWKYLEYGDLFHICSPVSKFMNSLPVPSASFTSHKLKNNDIRTYYMLNEKADTIYGWSQDVQFHVPALRFKNIKNIEEHRDKDIGGAINKKGTNYLKTLDPTFKPSPVTKNNKIKIKISTSQKHKNKEYDVEWYSAETGSKYQTSSAKRRGKKIKLIMPDELRTSTFGDAVFKVFLTDNCKKDRRDCKKKCRKDKRKCKKACRKSKKQCKRDAKRIKRNCIRDCKRNLRGQAKRNCKRECKSTYKSEKKNCKNAKKDCKKDCKTNKKQCKDNCKKKFNCD